MAKSLIIVESPAKAKTINKYLGRGYTVMASVGHVKDLPTSKLGVDIEREFTPHYVTIKGKAKVLSDIKKKAEQVDKVYLAPDPDREGDRHPHCSHDRASRLGDRRPHAGNTGGNRLWKAGLPAVNHRSRVRLLHSYATKFYFQTATV